MAKITAYSRIQHHGLTDPLSGATLPVSNDHTDGSWLITDIYDREILINTGNGNLQYRAGVGIYNVVSTFGQNIKTLTVQISNWDMTTATANNIKNFTASALINKQIIGMDAMIYPDPTSTFGINGVRFKYDTTDETSASLSPLRLGISDITNGDLYIEIDTGGGQNYFRFLSDGIDATFADGTNPDRGWIVVTYIE